MTYQYEDERDDHIVPLTEEGLHEAAGEVRGDVKIESCFFFIFIFF